MKQKIQRIMVAISVVTAPILTILLLWHLVFLHLGNRGLSAPAAIIGVFAGPILFPFVTAGTVISCCRSLPIKKRPIAIALGLIGIGFTGFTILFWWGMYHWGTIG